MTNAEKVKQCLIEACRKAGYLPSEYGGEVGIIAPAKVCKMLTYVQERFENLLANETKELKKGK